MNSKKSIITKYTDTCLICNNPYVQTHHLLSGSNRQKADDDSLICGLCDTHHNGDKNLSVHLNPAMNVWSKIAAQLAWEKHYIAQQRGLPFEDIEEDARKSFVARYGKSYI